MRCLFDFASEAVNIATTIMFIYSPRYLIAGLLLCLTCAEVMSEGKTYSKTLFKMDRLGKDDQVIVQRSGQDKMVGQYFCINFNCTMNYCENCFRNQSGYLTLYNISHLDWFDAFLNAEKKPFLQNFTLDEDVPSTSTTTAVPDETHIQQNEPLPTTNNPEGQTGEELPIGAKVAIGIIVAFVACVALVAIARRPGRDARIVEAFRSLWRNCCNQEPKQLMENPREMDVFVPIPNEV